MSTVTSLSNAEVKKLFERWGFTEAGGNGGHIKMRHRETGTIVQCTAPGRSTPTPMTALRKGAKVVGVPLITFTQGPPPPPKLRVVKKKAAVAKKAPVERIEEVVQPQEPVAVEICEPAAESEIARSEEIPESGDKQRRGAPTKVVLALLESQPTRLFTGDDVARLTGIPLSHVRQVLAAAVIRYPDKVKRHNRGVYSWKTVASANEIAVEDQRRAEEAVTAAQTYTKVAQDAYGRIILRDGKGALWVAIPVEQHFHPLEVPSSNGNATNP